MELKYERQDWADYVKAFAIWMMVFCHANLSNPTIQSFIHIFHMPVFFLISGYFDKGQPLSFAHIKKSYDGLIRPYFVYSVLGLTICWISPYMHPELYHGISGICNILKAAIIGMFMMDDHITDYSFLPLEPLWFLPALFICRFIWSCLLTLCYRRYWTKIMLLCIFCVLICYHRPSLFSIDSAIYGVPFYGIGFLLKKSHFVNYYCTNLPLNLFWCVLIMNYLFFVGLLNGRIDMDGCSLGNNTILFYINGVIGSMGCIFMAKTIRCHLEWLAIIGRNSLFILATHPFIVYICKAIAAYMFNADLRVFPIWGSALIACFSCAFCLVAKTKCNLNF